ncbi:efflux RND transporter periplasmic adaptor subunit [Veronia pacifica]|uniref:Uncharacterized protein n=1 Tax=Veronia pacifica TaxID=1080227 RepID=A0A1C3EPE9_9GAMM|nr:efflux RND transporter periplasmic adaptor subunit [Veronia pacifica]ODA35118.1 hypothetical protein A8L45_05420 [Veronia pacifica]
MKSLTSISLIALSLLLVTGCDEVQQQTAKLPPLVDVVTVGSNNQTGNAEFTAVAAASDLTRLSFQVNGKIDKINVKSGEFVKKGTLLATLDPRDLKLKVNDAKSRYDLAKRQYDRARKLRGTGALPKSQVDEIKANRDVARADYDLALLRLSFTSLTAPFDGIVSKISVEPFETIGGGAPILTMHDVRHIDFKLKVADQIYILQDGRPTEAVMKTINPRVVLENGEEYPLTLKANTGEPDPSTGAFMVTLTMPMPKDTLVLDGMSVKVKTNSEAVFASPISDNVPIEAIFNGDGDSLSPDQNYVWVVGNDLRVSKRQVEISTQSFKNIRVIGGLKPGERVVVKGVNKVMNGQQVRLAEGNES